MKIDAEKFALAVVSSSAPELTALKKLALYKEAYEEAESLKAEGDTKTKKAWNIK
jgi:hypothetical protein